MEINLSVVIVNELNNNELIQECVASIKKQSVKVKAVVVGGEHSKTELLNKGLELCKTEYVLFLNSYEELKEKFIEKCMAVFQNYPVGAVYTDFDKTYMGGIRECLPSFARNKITQGWTLPITAIYKTNVFTDCGNFDSSLSVLENWDMWFRISEKFPLYHIPESLYIVKQKPELTVSNDTFIENKKYILDKVEQRYNGN